MRASTIILAIAIAGMVPLGYLGGTETGTDEEYFTIEIDGRDYYLRIKPFSEKTIKIELSKDGVFKLSALEKYGFLEEGDNVPLEVSESSNEIHILSGENEVKIVKDPFALSLNGKVLHDMSFAQLSDSTNVSRCVFESDSEEHFFGLGQRFSSVDQKGKIALQQIEYGNKDNSSLSGVPFFMSTQGYGIFVDTTYRTVFDFQSADSYSVLTDDDNLRLFYIKGDNFSSILQEYTDITGKPSLPPRWTFGYIQSKYGYSNRAEFEGVARTMREMDFPCDGLNLDFFWRDNGGLEWDERRFPEHKQMIEELTERGYKIILHEDAATTKVYQGKIPQDYLYHVGNLLAYGYDYSLYPCYYGIPLPVYDISILDITNPYALQWYRNLHTPLMHEGIDGFWIDELDRLDENLMEPLYDGMLPSEAHNLYPNLYNRNIFEGMESEGERGVIITRSTWAGGQRYPWVWSGDIDCSFTAMKEQIVAGQTMGLSGIPFWSNDLGGFWGEVVGALLYGGTLNLNMQNLRALSNLRGLIGKPSDELQIRWTAQFGAFSPMMRAHGTGLWMEFSRIGGREPWQFNETAQEIFRFYDKLRYQLIPYIYSCAYESTQTGLPMMRALVLDFPHDENCYNQDSEYMFGPAFLVAPVCEEGARERAVYLPEGTWIDFWSNQIYEGPVEINYPAPLEILPLFVRGGSIIPTGPVMNYTDEKPLDPLTLWVYPQSNGTFSLYEDDGISLDHKNGSFAITPMSVEVQDDRISLHLGEKMGEYENEISERECRVVMKGIERPQSVKADGKDLEDWDYSDEKMELTINAGKISEIVVER